MSDSDDKSALVYLLAGFGLGALVGAAAGILFAPKSGHETREQLGSKIKELKGKTTDWVAEQKAKRAAIGASEEVGA
jgi:gas vesicle protein